MLFLVGDPMRLAVLQAAGVDVCASVVALSPSAPPQEIGPSSGKPLLARSETALDEANLLLVLALEQQFQSGAWSSRSMLGGSGFGFGFGNSNSGKGSGGRGSSSSSSSNSGSGSDSKSLWRRGSSRSGGRRASINEAIAAATTAAATDGNDDDEDDNDFGYDAKESNGGSNDGLHAIFDLYSPSALGLLGDSTMAGANSSAGDDAFAAYEPRAHRLFAAGRVIPKPCVAAMFSMAYYTPGILELLEALMNPSKYDQVCSKNKKNSSSNERRQGILNSPLVHEGSFFSFFFFSFIFPHFSIFIFFSCVVGVARLQHRSPG